MQLITIVQTRKLYRPVSLTSQVCKIFESIIRNAVVKHLESNMLILDSQHGFRKGRSRLTNLLVFLHHHHHFRLIIMVDKRSHTIDNKIGAKWYIGLHGTRL